MTFSSGTSSENFFMQVTVSLPLTKELKGKGSPLSSFLKPMCKYTNTHYRHTALNLGIYLNCNRNVCCMECHPSSVKVGGLSLEEVERRGRKSERGKAPGLQVLVLFVCLFLFGFVWFFLSVCHLGNLHLLVTTTPTPIP